MLRLVIRWDVSPANQLAAHSRDAAWSASVKGLHLEVCFFFPPSITINSFKYKVLVLVDSVQVANMKVSV